MTDENLVFINFEVLRCRSCIKTSQASVDTFYNDAKSILAEAQTKKEVEMEDSLLLK